MKKLAPLTATVWVLTAAPLEARSCAPGDVAVATQFAILVMLDKPCWQTHFLTRQGLELKAQYDSILRTVPNPKACADEGLKRMEARLDERLPPGSTMKDMCRHLHRFLGDATESRGIPAWSRER